jgi:hypothetical protein
VWVTGTGAFLLVAAATVFVAVQWDHLSNEVKLGILASVTGAFLLAGRRLRATLPATSSVMYHLGAFLIPANTAAVALHLQLEWPPFLLLEGATATAAWVLLDRVERSVVLRWAIGAAVVVTAAGVGAVTHTPTPILLALCAAGAEARRRHAEATAWALVAGLAPAIALTGGALPAGITTLVETLGLAGPTPQLTAVVTGGVAAAVIGRNAHRRRDLVLAAMAGIVAVLGITASWVGLEPGPQATVTGLAALFLVVELIVHLVRGDDFWGRPAHGFGVAAEALAVALTPIALGAAAWALATGRLPHVGAPAPAGPVVWSSLVAGALAAAGWFVADLRRRSSRTMGTGLGLLLGGGFALTSVLAPLSLLIGLACATASIPLVAVTAVALAGALILSGRPLAQISATGLVLGAVALQGVSTAHADLGDRAVLLTAALAVVGAGLLGALAVIRSGMTGEEHATLAWCAAVAAVTTLEIGWASLLNPLDHLTVLLGLAVACAGLALALDRFAVTERVGPLGWVARAAALVTLLQGADLPAEHLAVLGGVVCLLAVIDAGARRSPSSLFALAISLPITLAAWASSVHMSTAAVGLTLCVAAAAAAGVELLLPRTPGALNRWSGPALSVMVACATAGLVLSTESTSALSTAAIILAGIGAAYSVVHRSTEGVIVAGIVATLGIWGHLGVAGTTALDAYLAPVAIGLLAAGWRARAQRAAPPAPGDATTPRVAVVGSWVAYAPGIILLGGSALLERVEGGPGAHAVVAGAVGVLAVLAGGYRRLAAPLLLGTALLLGLTVNESLVVTRAVPTWGWLALGGTVLVAAGIAMERAETGPLESGRRLVDVVSERYR